MKTRKTGQPTPTRRHIRRSLRCNMSTHAQLLVAQPRPQRPVTAMIPNDQLDPSSDDDDLYRMRSTSLSSGHQANFRIVVSPEPQLHASYFPSNIPTRTPSPTLSDQEALLDAQLSPLDSIRKRFSEKGRFSRENISQFSIAYLSTFTGFSNLYLDSITPCLDNRHRRYHHHRCFE